MSTRILYSSLCLLYISFLAIIISCSGDGGTVSQKPVLPPAAPVISGIISGSFNTDQTFTITGENGALIEYSLDGGGSWNEYTGPVALSDEDTYEVVARQTVNDLASAFTLTCVVTINKTLPAPPVISGISGGHYNTDQAFTVAGTEIIVEYSVNGGTTWTAYDGTVILSSEGEYSITARQIDTAGNVSSQVTPITVVIDRTPPGPPEISGISDGAYYNNTVNFTINGEDGAVVEYTIDESSWLEYNSEDGVTLSDENIYTVIAHQIDLAGNESEESNTITITIDTTAPDSPVISGIADGVYYNSAVHFSVIVPGVQENVQYSLDGGSTWESYTEDEVELADEGEYEIVARQVDFAGNESWSTTYTVIIDLTRPGDVENLEAAETHATVTLSWTDPQDDPTFDRVRITFTPADSDVSQPIEVLKGSTSAPITFLENGTDYEFTIVSIDAAGNESDGVSISATPGDAAPEPGNGGAMTVSNVQNRSFWISWTQATDDLTPRANLLYKIVRSTNDNIATPDDAETEGSGRTVVKDWTSDLCWTGGATSWEIVGLTLNTSYYFTVLVMDEVGNRSIYATGQQTTLARDPLPWTNGPVNAMVTDGDILYIGGNFTAVGGSRYGAVLDSDTGVLPTSVAGAHINGLVKAVVSDGNDGWFIGGSFTSINGISRSRLARINADGSLHAWNPVANNTVNILTVSGSTVFLGGDFTTIGGTARNRLAAIGMDGTLSSWNPNANGDVRALAVSGNTVYVGGGFNTIGGTARNRLAAIDTDGTLMPWDPNANNWVYSIAVIDNIVYTGGSFTTIGETERKYIAAIGTDGTVTSWNPNANHWVFSLAISDSIVYAGGTFTSISETTRNRLAAIDTEGTLTSWNPSVNIGAVYALLVNGNVVYVGGNFTAINAATRNQIAAIDIDGTLMSWHPDANMPVHALAINGNRVYAGGEFSTIGGTARNRLAAIGTDGTLTSWNPNANASVSALAVCDSTVYAGGSFTAIDGTTRNRLAAIGTNGTLASWAPDANSSVNALAVCGSTVYIGGAFTTIDGTTRNRLAAIDTDGTLASWNPDVSSSVIALAVSDSTVYAGGSFTTIGGTTRNRLAAIGTDGTLASWDPDANSGVSALAVQDSTVYVGGNFTSIGEAARNRLAAIGTDGTLASWDPNANGDVRALAVSGSTVYVGGSFTTIGGTARNCLAAIDTDGNLTTWQPEANNTVYALAVNTSTMFAGGGFTTLSGMVRPYLCAIDIITGVPW